MSVGGVGPRIRKDAVYSAAKIRKDASALQMKNMARHAIKKNFNTYSLNKGRASLYFRQGDVSSFDGDAIISCTNQTLKPGVGRIGVDDSVHRAAGPGLAAYNKKLPFVKPNVKCPVGDTVVSPGFMCKAKYIIHTVGPVYQPTELGLATEVCEDYLYDAFTNCCYACEYYNVHRVAFPAISCGVYGYPVEECARIAFEVLDNYRFFNVKEVYFYLSDKETSEIFDMVAQEMLEIPNAIQIINPERLQNIGPTFPPMKLDKALQRKTKGAIDYYLISMAYMGGQGF